MVDIGNLKKKERRERERGENRTTGSERRERRRKGNWEKMKERKRKL